MDFLYSCRRTRIYYQKFGGDILFTALKLYSQEFSKALIETGKHKHITNSRRSEGKNKTQQSLYKNMVHWAMKCQIVYLKLITLRTAEGRDFHISRKTKNWLYRCYLLRSHPFQTIVGVVRI